MRRDGADENHLTPEDFLCDFCGSPWAAQRPMVEGHRGSLVCAACLSLAFDELWNRPGGAVPPGDAATPACRMCLETRNEPHWTSPIDPHARICRRCAKQSVVMLERDPESGFTRPGRA